VEVRRRRDKQKGSKVLNFKFFCWNKMRRRDCG